MRGSRELPFLLRAYREEDAGAALDLTNRCFADAFPHFVPKERDWWDWKFHEHPEGQRSLVAEDPTGRLIGFYGSLLLRVSGPGGPFLFAQSVDTVVDPSARRGLGNPGLFVRMAQAYESTYAGPQKAAVMYGLPIPHAYRIGSRFMDYWMLRAQTGLVFRDRRLLGGEEGVEASLVDRFPPELAELAACARPEHEFWGSRDAAWMEWRFSPRSGAAYRRRCARGPEGGLRGVAVALDAHFLGRDAVVLVDLLARPGDGPAVAALLAPEVGRAAARGQDLLALASPPSALGRTLLRHGFHLEPTSYVLVARPFHSDLPPVRLRRGWHYTLADLDVV
jgi:hypothetical protein